MVIEIHYGDALVGLGIECNISCTHGIVGTRICIVDECLIKGLMINGHDAAQSVVSDLADYSVYRAVVIDCGILILIFAAEEAVVNGLDFGIGELFNSDAGAGLEGYPADLAAVCIKVFGCETIDGAAVVREGGVVADNCAVVDLVNFFVACIVSYCNIEVILGGRIVEAKASLFAEYAGLIDAIGELCVGVDSIVCDIVLIYDADTVIGDGNIGSLSVLGYGDYPAAGLVILGEIALMIEPGLKDDVDGLVLSKS